MADFIIGRDTVLAELEPLSDLLDSLPHKAQFGPKNLVGHVWDKTREHGVKNLFNTLKERVQENTKSIPIEYTCVDVSFDAIVLGTNIGVIFLFDRTCKKLSRLPSEVGLVFCFVFKSYFSTSVPLYPNISINIHNTGTDKEKLFTLLLGDPFLYSGNRNVRFRRDFVRRNEMLVFL